MKFSLDEGERGEGISASAGIFAALFFYISSFDLKSTRPRNRD